MGEKESMPRCTAPDWEALGDDVIVDFERKCPG